MFNDIVEAAKQTVLERLAHPLLGSFTITWCLWNWKFLVILFSDASVTGTFALIETIAFPDWKTTFLKGLFFPLATATAYVFIYPYPARFVHEFTLRRQREIRQTQKRIEDETFMTIEDSRKLRSEYVEYERRNREQVAQLNEEVARLNAALESQEKPEIPLPLTPAERMFGQIEPSQLAILQLMDKRGGKVLEPDIIANSVDSKVKTEFDIGELVHRNLISRIYSRTRQEWDLDFTHDGRRVLLNDGKLGS